LISVLPGGTNFAACLSELILVRGSQTAFASQLYVLISVLPAGTIFAASLSELILVRAS
jgi:hypothetical protein